MANPSGTFGRLPRCGEESVLTYSGVVKRWECDRNKRWSVQFYVRAFQMASEVLAAATTGGNPGVASARVRHYRFHGDLFCPDTMRVQSSRIEGGECDGLVVHWMEAGQDGGRLAATAVEMPAYPNDSLPRRAACSVTPALPRGISAGPHRWDDRMSGGSDSVFHQALLGVVGPMDADHKKDLTASELLSRVGAATHHMLGRIGFTSDWLDQLNCSWMAVEMKITRHGTCRVGESLEAMSWITVAPGTQTFTTTHQLVNATTGTPCATVEQLMLVINLATRQPVVLPDFVTGAGQDVANLLKKRREDERDMGCGSGSRA